MKLKRKTFETTYLQIKGYINGEICLENVLNCQKFDCQKRIKNFELASIDHYKIFFCKNKSPIIINDTEFILGNSTVPLKVKFKVILIQI